MRLRGKLPRLTGLPVSDNWFGLVCRADVPAPARARLEAAWVAALNRPEAKGRLEQIGYTVLASPAAAFGEAIRRYAEVIRGAGIKVE